MYKILHRLFGWHYIMFSYGSDIITRRVKNLPNNKKYVRCYGSLFFVELGGKLRELDNSTREYIPLTWTIEAKLNSEG